MSNRIRELRKAKGLTQEQLAKHFGWGGSTISQYETDGRQPDRDALFKLADFFEVSIDYLYGRTDKKEEKPTPEDGDGLSETQKEIMKCVRQMSSQEQDAFLAWLQASQGHN